MRKSRQETGSDIDYQSFVILDERYLRDGTALMVEALCADEDGEDRSDEVEGIRGLNIQSLRAEPQLVNQRFLLYRADTDMDEDRMWAKHSEDGVLRESCFEHECACEGHFD